MTCIGENVSPLEGLFGWGLDGECMQKGVSTVRFVRGLSGSDRERVRLESASSGLLGMQPVRCKPPVTCWAKRRAGVW